MIFLIPKDDRYMDEDRKLQFDPRAMMPGPVVTGWRELIRALLKEWGNDSYKEQRLKLRLQTFDGLNQSDAVPKLLALIREQDWFC
ncbi:hypothetical protein HML84_08180 [Alcanivorax sp. IO_7]|nr:hypothetical protein HML84_08180 [Alcanivorax sp. IO_7]